ncbi:MAG: hypothetical protein WCK16_00955 [Candidatus Moraniibacteriota bacterium]
MHNDIRVYEIPKSYYQLNEYLRNEKETYSIAAFPINAYEVYDWNRTYNRFPQTYYFAENYIEKDLIYEKAANNLAEVSPFYKKLFYGDDNAILDSLKQVNAKYVLVWKNAYDITKKVNVAYSRFTALFGSNFKEIMNNNDFVLYENASFVNLLDYPNMHFRKINDSKYILFLRAYVEGSELNFFSNFNKNWKLYLNNYSGKELCQKVIQNNSECESSQNFFEGEELAYLYREPVFDNTHKIINDYANGWTIDADYVKQNFSKKYYKENPDGSIDVELVLYFKPQSFFYLGLIISGLTLTGLLSYLGYNSISKRRKNKLKKI